MLDVPITANVYVIRLDEAVLRNNLIIALACDGDDLRFRPDVRLGVFSPSFVP